MKAKLPDAGNLFLMAMIAGFTLLNASPVFSQYYDTIANWDGITQDWSYSVPGHQVVANPLPDMVNASAACQEFISVSGSYEYMLHWTNEDIDLLQYPRYRIKVYTPTEGGKLALKFENHNNTFAQQIIMDVPGGYWVDLEFDFSGLIFDEFVKMVIFPDIGNTVAGRKWYIDDILRELPDQSDFESDLPIFVISTHGQGIVNEPKIEAHLGIIDNGPGAVNRFTDPFNDYSGHIGIEIRGSSTQMFPKKAYGFETRDNEGQNLNVSLLGMPKENDWILYAPYTDKSMLRNVVTFAMGHKMSTYCTRTVFCEVFVNNDYRGVYVLMEKIKKDNNRVDIATLNPDEISGDDLTGGYIIKVDKTDWGYQGGVHGWTSSPDPTYPGAVKNIFQYVYPDYDEIVPQQKNYIQNFIRDLESNLASANYANPLFGYHQYLDVVSFADQLILSEIPKEVDKYRYSTYFYKNKDSNGGKLFAGPAWDFNLGYGNVDYWQPGINITGFVYSWPIGSEGRMFWWKRLMEDPYFQDLVKTRYHFLRQQAITYDFLTGTIDSCINLLGEAVTRNYERWPILGEYVWPNYNWQNNDYEDEVYYFKNFLLSRINWLDIHLPGKILQPRIGISANGNQINVRIFEDYFDKTRMDISDFQLNDATGGVTIQLLEYIEPSTCILHCSGNVDNQPQLSVTVKEDAFNTFENLTSNVLQTAGTGTPGVNKDIVRITTTGDKITLWCPNPENLASGYQMYDITGQSIASGRMDSDSHTISLPLKPGIYLVKVQYEDKPLTIRFLIP